MHQFGNFNVICGHYGCGKTNLSMNLAIDFAKQGRPVTVVDLDLVNPYFRSSDYEELLESHGIQVIAPLFAHSNLDTPALPAEMESIFSMPERTVIVDVGGDDAGAAALGRYAGKIKRVPDARMYYVVNRYRAQTRTPRQAADILREIEAASRLKADAVINNSHLQQLTTAEQVAEAVGFAEETAKLLELPVVMTTAPRALCPALTGRVDALYPVDIYVRPPWGMDG